MFLTLGTYKFEGVKLPQSWSTSSETVYGETAIIGNKPVVQKIGEKLSTIEIGIYLAIEFCIPQTELNLLQAARKAGEVMYLVSGTGVNYGKYVITSITDTHIASLQDGFPTAIAATLQLMEYNSNETVRKNNGAAVSTNEPIPQAPAVPTVSAAQKAYNESLAGLKNVKQIGEKVGTGSQTPGMFDSIFATAQKGIDAFDRANRIVVSGKKLVYRCAKLPLSYTQAKQALEDVKTASKIRNFNDLMNANTRLEAAAYYVRSSMGSLAAFVGSREGGE